MRVRVLLVQLAPVVPQSVTKTVCEKSQRLGVGSPGRYTKAPSKRPLTAGWMELNEPPSLNKAWCRCNYSASRPSSTPGLIRGMSAAALAAKERVLELSGTSVHCCCRLVVAAPNSVQDTTAETLHVLGECGFQLFGTPSGLCEPAQHSGHSLGHSETFDPTLPRAQPVFPHMHS